MNRKKISENDRINVLHMFDCHCAYCGNEINLSNMQIDHFIPIKKGGIDEKSNYMPSCRSCNFYKSTLDLEDFRQNIKTLRDRLEKTFIYRLAKRYNLIQETNISNIVFWFERKLKDERD